MMQITEKKKYSLCYFMRWGFISSIFVVLLLMVSWKFPPNWKHEQLPHYIEEIRAQMSPLPFEVAHRGFSYLVPENTLASLAVAQRLGGRISETDIQITVDGELVCFHDNHVQVATDVGEKIESIQDSVLSHFTLEELKELEVVRTSFIGKKENGRNVGRTYHDSIFPMEKVPTPLTLEKLEVEINTIEESFSIPTMKEYLHKAIDLNMTIIVEAKRPISSSPYSTQQYATAYVNALEEADRYISSRRDCVLTQNDRDISEKKGGEQETVCGYEESRYDHRSLYERLVVVSFFPDLLYLIKGLNPKIYTMFQYHPQKLTEWCFEQQRSIACDEDDNQCKVETDGTKIKYSQPWFCNYSDWVVTAADSILFPLSYYMGFDGIGVPKEYAHPEYIKYLHDSGYFSLISIWTSNSREDKENMMDLGKYGSDSGNEIVLCGVVHDERRICK